MKPFTTYIILILGTISLSPVLAMDGEDESAPDQPRIIRINGPYHMTPENARGINDSLNAGRSVSIITDGAVSIAENAIITTSGNLSITCTTFTNGGVILATDNEE